MIHYLGHIQEKYGGKVINCSDCFAGMKYVICLTKFCWSVSVQSSVQLEVVFLVMDTIVPLCVNSCMQLSVFLGSLPLFV